MKTIKCSCGRDIKIDEGSEFVLTQYPLNCRGSNGIYHRINQTHGLWDLNVARLIIEVPVGMYPDHKDRDTHNLQRANLRVATKSQNIANRNRQSNNTSGFIGVRQQPNGRWQMLITKEGHLYSSIHNTAVSAAKARDKKALELFGEFASLNFPLEQQKQNIC